MLEVGCNEANMWMMANAEARQADAIALRESEGVTVHTWSDVIIGLLTVLIVIAALFTVTAHPGHSIRDDGRELR